jgi:hypothetical protein
MDGVFDGDVLPGQQQLMPHQEEGVRRIMHAWLEDSVWDGKDAMFPLRSFLLFDEPGLGKTRQALTAIARLHERGIVGPYLVCAVKAVIPQWIDEANRHFAGTFTVRDFSKPTFQLTPNTLAVVSYGTLTSWFKYELSRPLDDAEHRARVYRGLDMPIGDATTDEEEKHLAHVQFTILQTMLRGKPRLPSKSMQKAVTCLYDTNWTAVVFDEVHVLSNTGTSQTRASRYLSATYRLGLSGTPLRNSGFDMISLLKYPLDIRKARFKLISDNPSGSYATTLLERATFGRLKKDVPEVAAVLAERDESSENLLVSWQDDPHARQQYLGIRNASKVTLDELAAMRKMPTETNFEFNLRRKRTVTDVWAVVRRMQQTCLHRCIPDMALKLETASGWPDWRPDTHAKFPTWFRAKVFTTLLCLKRAAPQGTLDHNMRRLICAYMAIGEEHAVQPSPKMLKFMQIYHHMLREGRNKIIAASESRVFLERILMPYLQTNGIGCVLYGGGKL